MRARVLAVVLAASGLACSSSTVNESKPCTPGASRACEGPNDCAGTQYCNVEGKRYEACICPGNTGGTGGSAGAWPGGTGGNVDASVEAGTTIAFLAEKDTYIDETQASSNWGTANLLLVRPGTVALLEFLLEDIVPPSAEVLSATLVLFTGLDPNCTSNDEHHLARVLERWQEGTQETGATGRANWKERLDPDGGPLYWTSPGAKPPGSSSSGFSTFIPDAADQRYELDVTEAVKLWVAQPAENYGLRVYTEAGDSCFVSIDAADVLKRPQLLVTIAK